jgi:hypothetical protein
MADRGARDDQPRPDRPRRGWPVGIGGELVAIVPGIVLAISGPHGEGDGACANPAHDLASPCYGLLYMIGGRIQHGYAHHGVSGRSVRRTADRMAPEPQGDATAQVRSRSDEPHMISSRGWSPARPGSPCSYRRSSSTPGCRRSIRHPPPSPLLLPPQRRTTRQRVYRPGRTPLHLRPRPRPPSR